MSEKDTTAAAATPPRTGRGGGADGKRVSARRREYAPRPAPTGSAQGDGRRRGGGTTQAASPVYVARRPLKIGQEIRQPGAEVPEAAGWHRVEAWIRSGHIERRPRRTKGTAK